MVFFQFYDQILHGGKIDGKTGLTCFQGQGHSQMGLSLMESFP
jgi:hypothetical protein